MQLHKHIGKAESTTCPHCDHPQEGGEHITFHYPKHQRFRQYLDKPIWVKEEDGEDWDVVEFLHYLHKQRGAD